jgi:glutamyl-tRNA reductase
MILGEPQILGQVSAAHSVALKHGAAGPVLSALFRAAIRAGKRARAETGISRNTATVSSVAIKLAEKILGSLVARQILVLGAGDMAEAAIEALRKRGASEITVVSRTYARAAQLAENWGAQTLPFEKLREALAAADVALTSTGASHFLITPDLARAALGTRPARPLVFIDIAVPRDVDPEVRHLPNTHYFDIDDLKAHLNGALAERHQEVPRVEAIIAEETQAFIDWFSSIGISALIGDLRAKAEAIRRAELEKTLRRLPQLSEADRRRIETMTEALVNKLLHDPTQRLKAEASLGQSCDYAAAARYLFALDG